MNSSYDYDIFISYRFRNNKAVTEGEEGWITNLQRGLEPYLSHVLGRRPKIWRCVEPLTEPIEVQLRDYINRAAVLIIVMFPDFIESKWCLDEIRWFTEDNQARGGVNIGNRSRIFVIRATHLAPERIPSEVEDLLGFDFFDWDYEQNRPINSKSKKVEGEEEGKYWKRISDLAYQIAKMLEQISHRKPK